MTISNVKPYGAENYNAVALTDSTILVINNKDREVGLSMPQIEVGDGTTYQVGLVWETDSELPAPAQLRQIIELLHDEIQRESGE